MVRTFDSIVIGGGFFGLNVADYLHRSLGQANVLVLEKESDFMQRASYNNQARVHGGYHYPRSLLTGLRSQFNFAQFNKDHGKAIVKDFDNYYAVAYRFSKVSARQFELFCDRIGAEIKAAPSDISQMFDANLIERVFQVKEYAFDSNILKKVLVTQMEKEGTELRTGATVENIYKDGDKLCVRTQGELNYKADNVFNCTYALINVINEQSGFPVIPLKHELAEICLIKLPPLLEGKSVTVMCGPFFSFMPFPARKLSSLSHVRYTPHSEWKDAPSKVRHGHEYLRQLDLTSNFRQMINDATRYLPTLAKSIYKDSLWEIKTVLQQSENNDSRPILFRRDHGLRGYHCIMGGKLDNIYDVFRELDLIYG